MLQLQAQWTSNQYFYGFNAFQYAIDIQGTLIVGANGWKATYLDYTALCKNRIV